MKINKILLILLLVSNGLWLGVYLTCEPPISVEGQDERFHYEPKIIFNVNTDSVRPGRPYAVSVFPSYVVSGLKYDVDLWGGSRHMAFGDKDVLPVFTHKPILGTYYLPGDSLFRDSTYNIYHKAVVTFPMENGDTVTLKDSARVPVVARNKNSVGRF